LLRYGDFSVVKMAAAGRNRTGS